MKHIEKNLKEELKLKNEILEKAREQLKKEFFGLDNIIDKIVNVFNPWFLFPSINSKPVVINLWGLTGTGKTSLIQRLSELINLSNDTFRFDMGRTSGKQSFKESIESLCDDESNNPKILILDEFQHARTLKKDGPFIKEIDKDENRLVWDLIDSGIIEYPDYNFSIWRVNSLHKTLTSLIKKGISVKNGIVQNKKKIFNKEIGNSQGKPLFIPTSMYERILDIAPIDFKYSLTHDLANHLKTLNESESAFFLHKLIKSALKPAKKDFSNSIIFVIGNLDEAYKINNNYSTDLSADEFHNVANKIRLSHIKDGLATRFRSEQIARLGNTHVIYPAFKEITYKEIITKEVNSVIDKFRESTGIKLTVSPSYKDLIYTEGVVPVQGTRPVFTTINQLLKSKLSFIYSKAFLNDEKITEVKLSHTSNNGSKSTISLVKESKTIKEYQIKEDLSISALKKSKSNDLQSIIAVHESGHAVCSVMLKNILPEVIFSICSDNNKSGFVYSRNPIEYTAKKDIVNIIATLLGGHIAEKLIFGEDYTTLGSESDIERATQIASDSLRKEGMGQHLLRSTPQSMRLEEFYQDSSHSIDLDIMNLVNKGASLAEEVLKKEQKLLLNMANYLSDNPKMDSRQILKYCNKYGSNFSPQQLIKDGDNIYYRNKLKALINQNCNISQESPIDSMEIILNKKT